MITPTKILSFALLLGSIFTSQTSVGQVNNELTLYNPYIAASTLRNDMTALWKENATLTYKSINCIVDNKPGIDEVRIDVLNNQTAIANLIGEYYGAQAEIKINKMLHTNITLSAYVMMAARNGDVAKFNKADAKWRENTVAMITYLSFNSSGDVKNAMNTLMNEQMANIEEDITTIKNGKLGNTAILYNNTVKHAMLMSDFISNNIIRQFPKFAVDTVKLIGVN